MKNFFISLCAVFSLCIVVNVSAADAKAGKEKAISCAGCHGVEGISAAGMFPNLAGQKAEYFESALKAYRDGDRVNDMMTGMARDLSDETIADLAAYYSELKTQ